MTKPERRLFPDAAVAALGLLLFLFSFDFRGLDPFCVTLFAANGVFSLAMLLLSLRRAGVSAALSYWMFSLLFFFAAPLIQYAAGDFPWIHRPLPDGLILAANQCLLVWNLIIAAATMLPPASAAPAAPKAEERVSERLCRGCAALALLLALLYLARNGLRLIGASRSEEITLLGTGESALQALFNKGAAAFLYGAAAFGVLHARQGGKRRYAVLSLLALMVCYFPTRIARYLTAAIYGGLLLLLLPRLWEGKRFFRCFAAAVLLLFPLMDIYRTQRLFDADFLSALRALLRQGRDSYLTAHYDAYSMLCAVLRQVREQGTCGGRQLLGCLLFFVPRSLWPSKPIGSGAMVSYALGYDFHNVSCPLPGEGLVNFGLPGLLLFALGFGLLLRRADAGAQSGEQGLFFRCLYPVTVLFVFFLVRGDLMSAFSYYMAFAAVLGALSAVNRLLLRRGGEK